MYAYLDFTDFKIEQRTQYSKIKVIGNCSKSFSHNYGHTVKNFFEKEDLEYTFANCEELQQIIMPPNITTIGDNVFENCIALQDIVLSETLQNIGKEAFFGTHLNEIIMPETLKEIKKSAFEECKSLHTVKINGSTKIGDYAFLVCTNLVNLILSNKICYIGKGSFCGCKSLKEIIIPKNVKIIKEMTFMSCDSLEYIYIYKSLKEIEPYAFTGKNLKKIFYEGNKKDWEEIIIGENNSDLLNAKILYNMKGVL